MQICPVLLWKIISMDESEVYPTGNNPDYRLGLRFGVALTLNLHPYRIPELSVTPRDPPLYDD